jgi:hypothetical protein
MSDFEIDFEWPVAEKYELRPATADEVSKYHRSRTLSDYPQHPPKISDTDWPLYLGRIMPVGKLRDHRPKAETMERAVKVLFGALDNPQVPFHTVALKVVQSLGGQMRDSGDSVDHWYYLAQKLRMMFEGRDIQFGKEYRWPEPETWDVGDVGIYLVPDKNKNRVLALRPHDIHGALILYAARMIATGTTFNICEHCKTPFLSGGTRFRNKRGDARFCSDECRWRWHNESRRKAR